MHTLPIQKQISGIKGKIRGVYAVKTLHIWQKYSFFMQSGRRESLYKKGRRDNTPA